MLFAECVRQTHTHTLTHTYINLYIEVVFQHMQKPIKPSMAWRGCRFLSAPLRTFCSPLRPPPDDIVSLAYCVVDAYLRISIKFVKKIEMCDSRRFTRGIGSGDFAVEGAGARGSGISNKGCCSGAAGGLRAQRREAAGTGAVLTLVTIKLSSANKRKYVVGVHVIVCVYACVCE